MKYDSVVIGNKGETLYLTLHPENRQMKAILKPLFICVLSAGSPVLWALSDSLYDPDLSVQTKETNRLQGVVSFRLTRNIRIPLKSEDLWNPLNRHSVFGAMNINSDISLSYPLLEKYTLFFSLNYGRLAVVAPQELKDNCWFSYLCIGDMSLGVSIPPFLRRERFYLKSSVYLNLPTSRHSVKVGIGGLGILLNSSWKLISLPNFQLSTVSTHFLEVYTFTNKNMDYLGQQPNNRVVFFNQPGLSFRYSGLIPVPVFREEGRFLTFRLKSVPWLLPSFYFYGGFRSPVDTKLKFRHSYSLSASAAWTVKKKFRISTGLRWGERAFLRGGRVIGKSEPAHRTYVTLGMSYAF